MTTFEIKRVKANGLEFAYLEAGEGPLVLCLHGFPDTPHGYAELLPKLAAAGYRAVAPFARGHAPTEMPGGDQYSIEDLGKDALGLIEALGEKRAILIGHDWGAVAAYAAANLEPAKVEKLVVIAIPHARANRPNPGWLAMVTFFQVTPLALLALRARSGALVDLIYRLASPKWRFTPEDTAPFKALLEAPAGPRPLLGVYRSVFTEIRRLGRGAGARLLRQRVSVPTLAFGGTNDPTVRRGTFEGMGDAFTGGYEPVILKGTGHFPHREQPAEFWEHLLPWLKPLAAPK